MQHPVIKKLIISERFKYLWLKYVTGVDLDQHCAKGLIGAYSTPVTPRKDIENLKLDEHDAKVYYLCGVATPYEWSKNFHLAFEHCPGETVSYSSNGIDIQIADAKRIDFEGFDMSSVTHPKKHLKAYNTCRNWIFANHCVAKGILKLA